MKKGGGNQGYTIGGGPQYFLKKVVPSKGALKTRSRINHLALLKNVGARGLRAL